MHPKITILGCGLSGMITALAFAKHNIPITIIEGRSSKDKDFFKDVRTTALTYSSKIFFQEVVSAPPDVPELPSSLPSISPPILENKVLHSFDQIGVNDETALLKELVSQPSVPTIIVPVHVHGPR